MHIMRLFRLFAPTIVGSFAIISLSSCASPPETRSCLADVGQVKLRMEGAGLSSAPDPRTVPQPSRRDLLNPPNYKAQVADRDGRVYTEAELMDIRDKIRAASIACRDGDRDEAELKLHVARLMLEAPQGGGLAEHPPTPVAAH